MEEIIKKIKTVSRKKIKILVVSGSHYRAIIQSGIDKTLSDNISFVYGPANVLCSVKQSYFDKLLLISQQENVITAISPEFLQVSGLNTTLEEERKNGADIRVFYTFMDILLIAKHKRRHKVIFPALGFETATANTAATILQAQVAGLFNFKILNGHKRLLNVVDAWLKQNKYVNALLFTPQDVAIVGTNAITDFNIRQKKICAIAGMETEDILQAILYLVTQFENDNNSIFVQPDIELLPEGITKSQQLINEVFGLENVYFPGLGVVPLGGYSMNKMYALHNADTAINKNPEEDNKNSSFCNEITSGKKTPYQCAKFKNECNPLHPLGTCMASKEGLCNISFFYNKP